LAIILFEVFKSLSSCTELSIREGRKASSFAIFGLWVGFARIANVLGLVRRLATNIAFPIFSNPLIKTSDPSLKITKPLVNTSGHSLKSSNPLLYISDPLIKTTTPLQNISDPSVIFSDPLVHA
jgi:spore maturation protein SpmA